MWRCPQCNELVDAPLVVCWRCGTAPDGEVHPAFPLKEPARPPPGGETDPDRTPMQFSLRSLFVFVTLCSFLLAAGRCLGGSIIVFIAILIFANIFSATVGVIVTPILPKQDESGNYP